MFRLSLQRAFAAGIRHGEPRRVERLIALSETIRKSNEIAYNPVRLRGSGAFTPGSGAFTPPTTPSPPPLTTQHPPLPTERRMAESFVSLDLPLSSNSALRGEYVGARETVRLGKLMEGQSPSSWTRWETEDEGGGQGQSKLKFTAAEFDSIAGAAAYRFVLPDGASISEASSVYGLYLVTASVDRMDLLASFSGRGDVDLRLSGHVSYASGSSLEVLVRLSTIPPGDVVEPTTILLGRFAMACRSSTGGKHPVAKLIVEGPAEEELYAMGKELKERKRELSAKSIWKTAPSEEESQLLHDLFIGRANIFEKGATTPSDIIFMGNTRSSTALLMHPTERNVHNKIFGGHLMRLAYESAYTVASGFAQAKVSFVALDSILFTRPVEVGSLLTLESQVSFSPIRGSHKTFHVSVEAFTSNIYTGEKLETNTFTFTFSSETPLERHVLPRSYKEAMRWLDGRRRRDLGIAARKEYGF